MSDKDLAFVNAHDDDLQVTLAAEDVIHPRLLQTPSRLTFGGDDTPDITRGTVRLRIGRRPMAQSLRRLYERHGAAIPDEYEIFWAHELWLINHSVGILHEGDDEEVEHVCYELRFPEDTTIVEVLPQPRFITEIDGKYSCRADIGLNGRANPISAVRMDGPAERLYFGGEFGPLEQADLLGRISFDVFTSRVQAIGAGDYTSQFVFSRDTSRLVGYQSMSEIVLVDKHATELPCAARLQTTISGLNGVPARLRSEWIPLLIRFDESGR